MPGNKNEYRASLGTRFRPGLSRVLTPAALVPDASLTTKGLMYALARARAGPRRIAWTPFMGLHVEKVGPSVLGTFGVAATAGSGTPGTVGADADGTYNELTLTVVSASQALSRSFGNGEVNRLTGFYVWFAIKIPTTANQTNLFDRAWRLGFYTSTPTSPSADPAGHFFEWKFNEQTDTEWLFRSKDGTTASTLSTGVIPELDTYYVFECWSPGNNGSLYASINGGEIIEKTTNLPGQHTPASMIRIAMIVDQGDLVNRFYGTGVVAF